jgi:hypothetical protein
MKGKLLDQWADAFRQDTNSSLILYVIVFLDGESTAGMWEIDDVSIKFASITDAFGKLFFISYVKTLFDESYAGKPVIVPAVPGTAAVQTVRVTNGSGADKTIDAGTHAVNDGVKAWTFEIASAMVIPPGGYADFDLTADDAGVDANI